MIRDAISYIGYSSEVCLHIGQGFKCNRSMVLIPSVVAFFDGR